MSTPFMKISAVAALGAMMLPSASAQGRAADAGERPNFLFIMFDDLPYDALQSMGRYDFLQDPNAQRLQKEGAIFQNMFCTHSLSSPSRASILTGTYSHINGVTENGNGSEPDWDVHPTFGKLLQQAGYCTAFVGKTHMAKKYGKDQVRPGFDYWLAFRGQGDYIDPELNLNGEEFVAQGYMTDLLTQYAADFIRDKRDKSKPFSICLWHKAIHDPNIPAERHKDLYQGEDLKEPPYGTYNETFKNKPSWQRGKFLKKEPMDPTIPAELQLKTWKGSKSVPKAMDKLRCIKSVDESLGVLMDVLEEEGVLDNTVIIYTSDNGYFFGDHTLGDKRLAYEAAMRIPFLIRYPKLIAAGSKIPQLCISIDATATILDMAGAETPEHIQGESFVSLFSGKKNIPWRQSVFYEYFRDTEYPFAGPNMVAVRTDRYKYVDGLVEGDLDELYDLKTDPGEMKNLIDDPKYAKVLETMKKELERLKVRYKYNPDRDWRPRQMYGPDWVPVERTVIKPKKK